MESVRKGGTPLPLRNYFYYQKFLLIRGTPHPLYEHKSKKNLMDFWFTDLGSTPPPPFTDFCSPEKKSLRILGVPPQIPLNGWIPSQSCAMSRI